MKTPVNVKSVQPHGIDSNKKRNPMTPIQYNRFVVAQDHTHKTSGTNNWFTQAVEKYLLGLPPHHHN